MIRSRKPWELGLSGSAWQQRLKLFFDTYRFSTTWLLLEQSRCVKAAQSRRTQKKRTHSKMFQKSEIFTYLPSAQASFMPWSGMADVRKYYIQIFGLCEQIRGRSYSYMCTLESWILTMCEGSSMRELMSLWMSKSFIAVLWWGVTWPGI